ncbi:NAD(P)H-binding protein [Sedimentibacter hydroxybenzoicus DSM 7310]|uniref:NAD(P)H-binding protein n=1 Tax=Sedimentibacter hydroxybenzoicus DSM 7310 TaxID=1123245 RepID=A0A974BIE1_SEDHY|nr:NAD(P)H-binding protein [Sedimentibacter hydroxybenzoicus]NYB73784.1 NAD(P)H-binding protein [Sedimentibacter hydroxybenzoicus DSM 7310]
MRIAIIGATGKSGSMILNEALRRNLDCTVIIRRPERLNAKVPYIQRDVFGITVGDIAPFDVIVSAFGNEDYNNRKQHIEVIEHYQTILKNSGKRLITVGAAGHLFTDKMRQIKFYDNNQSEEMREACIVLEQAYLTLKNNSIGFDWTYMAPAIVYSWKGERTGKYQTGLDIVLKNSKGKSVISYADYAAAMLDEIENPQYVNTIFTVANCE